MARIINKIINLKIKKRKHRIILIRKINNNRIIIINKINRQRSRNQWMTKSLMLMEMIFSFRSSRELNKILRSNKRKRKRKRLMKECLKSKMIKWKILINLKWWMINKSKIKIRIKMHRNLRRLSKNINLMMKKQTSYRAIWLLTILKMQKCSIKKMKKINKTKMERAKNLLKMNKR